MDKSNKQFPPAVEARMDKRYSNYVPPGWYTIVENLDKALAEIHPDYQLIQVKEKFGGLRYYTAGVNSEKGQELISVAEDCCAHVCHTCGKPGRIKEVRYWLECICDSCLKQIDEDD